MSEAALIVIVVAALLAAAGLVWGWRETGRQAALGLAFSFIAASPFAAALGALSADGAYARASLGLLGAGVIAAVASALAIEEDDAPDEVFPPGTLR